LEVATEDDDDDDGEDTNEVRVEDELKELDRKLELLAEAELDVEVPALDSR
jgi:hypothetical protein